MFGITYQNNSFEGYCPNCGKRTIIVQRIERAVTECKIIKVYCNECKEDIKEYDNIIIDPNDISKYIHEENIQDNGKTNVFNSKKIYKYQQNIIFWVIIISVIWISICIYGCKNLNFGDNGLTTKIIFFLMMPLPGYLYIILSILTIKKITGYNKMNSYIKKMGKCTTGKVTRIICFYDEDTGAERYMEIEYQDQFGNNTKRFMTPRLKSKPNKKMIECDVYQVKELPKKYKNKKYSQNAVAENFR